MKKLMLRTVGIFFAGALGLGFSIFGPPKGVANATVYCSNNNEGAACYDIIPNICQSQMCPASGSACIVYYSGSC